MRSPLLNLFLGLFRSVSMFVSTVVSRVLQSLEFFRSGFGRYFFVFWQNSQLCQIFTVFFFIWGVVRLVISSFTRFCSFVSESLQSLHFSGVTVGGVDILSFANSVLPIDETMALVVVWFSVYSVCATIRFVRAAWAAIPFKAT